MKLDRLFRPQSIAVVGASVTGAGWDAYLNLKTIGFEGRIELVNPHRDQIGGVRCVPSVSRMSAPVDVAIVAVAARHVLGAIEELKAANTPAAVVFANGFAEVGPAGGELQEALVATARSGDMAILGPNCMGFVAPAYSSALYMDRVTRLPPSGRVAVITQSGSVGVSAINHTGTLRTSAVVSVGNEAVVNSADVLRWLLEDGCTSTVALYLEGFSDADALIGALDEAADRGVRVVVCKTGQSRGAAQAARSHTGALASDTRIVRAVLSAHGATVVEDVDQLFCAAELLATERTAGSRLGGATISGGHVGLLLDSAEKEGLSFPNLTLSASSAVQRALGEPRQVCNPVDCWVDGRVVESVRDAVAAMATDASLGGFVLALDAPRDPPTSDPGLPIDIASAVAVIAEEDDRPWVVVSTAISADDPSLAEVLSRRGIPRLSGLAQAFKAWSAVARTTRDPVPERVDKTWSGPIPTTDAEAFRLVAGWGISSATFSECRTLSEACRDAARIGYPVVLKVVQPGLLHKSDSGGVRLGITNEAELTVAYGEIKRAHPAMDAVLVAEQVADGLDVFVGAYMDREFGPVVLFGPGGILVELVDETTVIAAPTTAKVIDQKLNGTRLESLLGGYRGREPGSREALCQAVARVSILIASSGRKGVSIDINPLRVTLEGAIALDVKVEGVASDG